MKRDIIVDIFLGAVLLSILFVFSFPVFFAYNANVPRDISLFERMMSVCFLLAFILTGIWACWKKKIWVAVGLASYAILAYFPKWFLPKLNTNATLHGHSIINSLLTMLLNRIYEVTHAPFTGLIGIVSEKKAEQFAYKLLPMVIIGYILAQIIHFYYKAYVTEKKQKHDFAHFRRTQAQESPAYSGAAPVVAVPLGTVIKDENDEIAKETYSVKPEPAPTMEITRDASATQTIEAPVVPVIERTAADTQVISLAATAPTSKQVEEETKVISLAATAPTSKPEETTQVIALAATAPTSSSAEPPVEEVSKESEERSTEVPKEHEELDFPDVHGEAERIDVFGDSEP